MRVAPIVRTIFLLPLLAAAIPALCQDVPPVQADRQPLPPPQASDLDLQRSAAEAVRINSLARINGLPYDQPSAHDTFIDYVRDTYGLPALIRTSVRTVYAEARGKPQAWGGGIVGLSDRFGSAAGINIINGNVRYAMELTFHEDLRYIPCQGCKVKAKIENALLAEITARHDSDGHRFFTLTPTIADFSGPIIAHSTWYPNGFDPLGGVISARLVFATRIGSHLFREFVWTRYRPGLRPGN